MELSAGMFFLGGFVGAIVTFGLNLIQNWNNAVKAIATILGAALGGVVVVFIKDFDGAKAIPAYCAGLLVALMWAYIDVKRIGDPNKNIQILGWLHIFASGVVTIIIGFIFVFPLLLHVWRGAP